MMFSPILVLFILFIVSINGFLMDSSTKFPQAGSSMSDKHFITLLNLLAEEKNARQQLENVVQRLQQELTSKVDSVGNCNCKAPVITDELNNDTYRLQNELDLLRKDFKTLQLQCTQFDKRLSTSEANTGRLKQDIAGLKLENSVKDLHSIFNLENKTNQLEIKVQNTENSIRTILSSANVRSQDMIGLFNKIKETDNMTFHLENEIQKSNNRLDTAVNDINSRKQDFIALVNRISNRAVLSVWTAGGTVATSAVIPFKQVRTSHGITDLKSIKNEGKFTCEKAGLYLISVFLSTPTNSNGFYYVYKNDGVLVRAFIHPQSYVLTSTAIVTERLQINDTVYVKNGQEIYVYSSYDSTFSIIQIE